MMTGRYVMVETVKYHRCPGVRIGVFVLIRDGGGPWITLESFDDSEFPRVNAPASIVGVYTLTAGPLEQDLVHECSAGIRIVLSGNQLEEGLWYARAPVGRIKFTLDLSETLLDRLRSRPQMVVIRNPWLHATNYLAHAGVMSIPNCCNM
jgi:hypothetical protein